MRHIRESSEEIYQRSIEALIPEYENISSCGSSRFNEFAQFVSMIFNISLSDVLDDVRREIFKRNYPESYFAHIDRANEDHN